LNFYNLNEAKKYLNQLMIRSDKKVFTQIVQECNDQKGRLLNSINQIEETISKRFPVETLTYKKFDGTIASVLNTVSDNYVFLNRMMESFDDSEYKRLQNNNISISKDLRTRKLSIFEDNIIKIRSLLQKNEETMIQLDQIIPEVVKLNDNSDRFKSANREIDELINQLRLYKR
jgi:hypothetical protein